MSSKSGSGSKRKAGVSEGGGVSKREGRREKEPRPVSSEFPHDIRMKWSGRNRTRFEGHTAVK